MNAVVGADLFHGFAVGNGSDVRLTHLQFADDTLIMGGKSWLNVRSMRAVLLLFDDVSCNALFNYLIILLDDMIYVYILYDFDDYVTYL